MLAWNDRDPHRCQCPCLGMGKSSREKRGKSRRRRSRSRTADDNKQSTSTTGADSDSEGRAHKKHRKASRGRHDKPARRSRSISPAELPHLQQQLGDYAYSGKAKKVKRMLQQYGKLLDVDAAVADQQRTLLHQVRRL